MALSMLLAAGTLAPALAADNDGLDTAVNGSLLVTRVGGLAAGLVIGTPIAVVREIGHNYMHFTEGAADKIGGHDNGPACVLASIFSIPAALVVGSAKGLYAGTKNGVQGFNSPFQADSFSSRNLDE